MKIFIVYNKIARGLPEGWHVMKRTDPTEPEEIMCVCDKREKAELIKELLLKHESSSGYLSR